ncbi:MAG: DUF4386 domain-containing protein [Cyclobacteriaceae bacterium]
MDNKHLQARKAGFAYLALVITGMTALMYIPTQLIDWESASTTFSNIQDNELLFRLGIFSEVLMLLAFIALAYFLYDMLHKVNPTHAVAMVVFVLLSIPISLVNLTSKFLILKLISQTGIVELSELHSQVMVYLESYFAGLNISNVFWGIWLFPFGYLVWHSGFLPKFFGFFLMAGAVGYFLSFSLDLLWAGFNESMVKTIVDIPSQIGELGICLWMTVAGARTFSLKKK